MIARPDAIDQLARRSCCHSVLRELRVARRRVGRGDELIDQRIADVAGRARPLLVRCARRRHGVARQQVVGHERADLAERVGVIRASDRDPDDRRGTPCSPPGRSDAPSPTSRRGPCSAPSGRRRRARARPAADGAAERARSTARTSAPTESCRRASSCVRCPPRSMPVSASFSASESLARSPRRRRLAVAAGHVLVHPVDDRLQHLAAVLLDHHHVAVAVDAELRQPQLLGLHAGLLQERDRRRDCPATRTTHRRSRSRTFVFFRFGSLRAGSSCR